MQRPHRLSSGWNRRPTLARAVPDPATEPPVREAPRGLVLHVLLSEESASVSGTELAEVAELLREMAEELLPAAATYTTLSLGSR